MKKTILLLCSALLCQFTMAQQVSIPSVIKGITVILSYQDYPMNDPIQEVDNMMNQVGYNGNGQLGSVRDYFYTQTSGKVTITSTVVKVNLAYTKAYYDNVNYVDEAIDSINKLYPNGFQGLTPDPVDGTLMHINFISRANGRSSTNGASANPARFIKNNTTQQIRVDGGNMTFLGNSTLNINTICHEMGHSVLSWTDYYRTAYSNLGKFCLMASAGTMAAPQPINPALRMQRGWIDNVIEVSGTTTQTYTLTANSYTTVHKYTNPNNPKEYLLFHALKIGGYYQSPISGKTMPEGLAIWYVDEETGYDSPLNPNQDNQRYIRLVQADNKDEMHDDFPNAPNVGGDLEDLYGNANKSFPNGTPFRWKDGGEFGINISNISNPGTTMSFTVNARPNTVVASSDIFGNISPKGTLSVAGGQSRTFSLTPNPGYEVDVLKVDGANVTASNPYTLSNISGTKTFSATFKRKANQAALPNDWQKSSIGNTNSSDFVASENGKFYLETHGNSLGGSEDNFTYVHQEINGDGVFVAYLANYNTLPFQNVGLMLRESLESNSAFAAISKTDMGGATAIQRASTGQEVKYNPSNKPDLHLYELHNWLKITRTGDLIGFYTSKNGIDYAELGVQTIPMASKAYVGFFSKGNGYTTYPAQALFDSINFINNPFPTVSLTSPANGTVLTTNSVTITATASPADINGSITKVDFYDKTTLIGTDNTAPYSFVWNNVSGGIHTVIAKATDNVGREAVSSKAVITVPCSSAGTKISGTAIGTPESWNDLGNTHDKAFDGNINSYFDAKQGTAWTGLSLANDYTVTRISYVPREGLEGRMIGGKFQGSNVADFSTYTELAEIPVKPSSGWNCFDISNTTTFRYLRYVCPEGGYGNVSEIEFYGNVQAANQQPTVSLTSPVHNSSHAAPATLSLNASASDADGSVWKVEFFNGNTLIGTDYAAPYQYMIFGLAAGTYSIKAVAYDDQNLASDTAVSTVNVTNGNSAPTVSITSPLSNSSFVAPATITINTEVEDVDDNIWKVEFYSGSTLLGSDFTAPYSYTWSNVLAGVYNITALVIDEMGASASSTRNNIAVIANQAPEVSITAPANNASYTAPATVNITANAADADGTVSKVEFFNGTTLLNTDMTAPYSYSWTGVAAGTYTITAKVTDNNNAVTTSTAVNITVTASTADITGPACVSNNTTVTYEVSPAKRTNATGYGWYFTGSTQSFTSSGYQATMIAGNNFGSGQLCVGVNMNVSPWYTTYCITVPKCTSTREANVIDVLETELVTAHSYSFPNPFNGETTISLATQSAKIQIYNANGQLVEEAVASGSYTFGSKLNSGIYFVKINSEGKSETLKVVKQ